MAKFDKTMDKLYPLLQKMKLFVSVIIMLTISNILYVDVDVSLPVLGITSVPVSGWNVRNVKWINMVCKQCTYVKDRVCRKHFLHFFQFETPGELSLGMDY